MNVPPKTAFRRSLWGIVALGALVFALLIPPNLHGAVDIGHMTTGDEHVTYPYVLHMLEASKDFSQFWWRTIIYGDYHYGYPFYFTSMVVLLPQRLILGDAFFDQTPLNLLVLRQLIGVLPLLLSAGLLVYLQTRFRSVWQSAALFLFILAVPAVMRQNIQWWHPDALSILAVVLTLFFLDRDRLRFGRNFWFASVACGLATAIKLQGPFFVLTIAGYLLAGRLQRRVSSWRMVALGAGFTAGMIAVTLLSNPFLFYPTQLEKMVAIQTQKQQEMSVGYSDRGEDPNLYRKEPEYWRWTLETWYGSVPLLIGLAVALAMACLGGKNRFANLLILGWVLPYSLYLLYGVAPKPDHYWLPVMLTLFSAAFTPLEWLSGRLAGGSFRNPRLAWAARAGSLLLAAILCAWLAANLAQDIQLYRDGLIVDQVRYNLPD